MEIGIGIVNRTVALSHWLRQTIDRILTDEPMRPSHAKQIVRRLRVNIGGASRLV